MIFRNNKKSEKQHLKTKTKSQIKIICRDKNIYYKVRIVFRLKSFLQKYFNKL